ncbi:Uncharacterised protein [Mycobacteroides abscessus subsp. abscessus]|nr:Uncharacterised protein [Mycobacteroides abscessus subsp. abscessus]
MREGQQRLGDQRRARRRRPVDRVGGAHQQRLGIVRGVEPAATAVGVGEVRQRGVEQAVGCVEPGLLAGHLMQRQQACRQRRVVLQDPGAVADDAAEAGPAQPAVDQMQIQQPAGATRCRVEEFTLAECDGRLRQRRDGEAVPRGDDLVVASRLRPQRPGCQQLRADLFEACGVVGVSQ